MAIFEFLVSHFATSLLQCSVIFYYSAQSFYVVIVNSVILSVVLSHFRELSHFLVATVNLTIISVVLIHFAILLSHFVFCYSELSHFYDPVSHFSLLR
jgi:hypothetical protein